MTQVVRGSRLLRHHDTDIADHLHRATPQRRYDLRQDTEVCGIKPGTSGDGGVTVHLEGPYGADTVDADVMLLATGRVPNSDLLNVRATGVDASTRTAWSSSTSTRRPRSPASTRSATSARPTRSSMSPTTRRGWSGTT